MIETLIKSKDQSSFNSVASSFSKYVGFNDIPFWKMPGLIGLPTFQVGFWTSLLVIYWFLFLFEVSFYEFHPLTKIVIVLKT